jgi:hypothetical protein
LILISKITLWQHLTNQIYENKHESITYYLPYRTPPLLISCTQFAPSLVLEQASLFFQLCLFLSLPFSSPAQLFEIFRVRFQQLSTQHHPFHAHHRFHYQLRHRLTQLLLLSSFKPVSQHLSSSSQFA